MPVTAPARMSFLSWVREGAASAIAVPDTLGPQPGAVTLTAAVAVNGGPPVRMPARLLGPSDVVGLDAREIVRREPPPGSTAFESNHFPCIEFDRADFPWLFTPAQAATQARLRPWLCLVVVRNMAGVTLRPPMGRPLPSIEIASAVAKEELPDLDESWWWAHTQVAAGSSVDGQALRTTLAGDPAASLSRLLCPRQLAPETEYFACLVPAFEPGRKAGLGLPVDSDEPIDNAWTAASIARGPVELPLYDHWTFRTGAGGDFRTLAKLLHAEPAPEGLGRRPLRISQPGFALPADFPPDATVQLEGALRPMRRATAPEWPAGTMAPFQAALAPIVNALEMTPAHDPLLAPPLYGRWHAGRDAAAPGADWFDELNLDPRHRVVAALGTRVVQEHQEALMSSAWQQAGDAEAANQRLRQLQLGALAGESLQARHFERMEPDVLLRVSAPALGRVRSAAGTGAQRPTLASEFVATALPLRSLAPAMRRMARPRGPVPRRLARVAQVNRALDGFVARVNLATAIFVAPPPPAMASFQAMQQQSAALAAVRAYPQVTQAAVAAVPGAPQFRIEAEGKPVRASVEDPDVPGVDNAAAAAFRAAAQQHLQKLDPQRPWPSVLVVRRPLDLGALGAQLRSQMQPRARLVALADAVLPGQAALAAPDAPSPLSPVAVVPRFPQPMYEPLRDLSQELLLPGLAAVQPNTVLGLRTNPRFVHAYLVGLNFEMGRELLWRGYPTDQRGTCFDQFWDTAGAAQPQADIEPLLQWGTRPLAGEPAASRGNFVMLLRSELLRRYPTASIYAVPAVRSSGRRVPDTEHPEREQQPLFRGSLPPDVSFFGFALSAKEVAGGQAGSEGWFIVIEQQATEPQFGLDVAVAPGAHLRAAAEAPEGLPPRDLQWGHNAAHMAGILRRLPVRIAIHGSQFVAPQDLADES